MSTLLEQASLVMIPSGYKEDVVYSQIPTSGAGDLSFTRASNGTRVNSAGLVEVVPWNLLQYSEEFDNAYWSKFNDSVTANATTAPNGTTTADKEIPNTTNDIHGVIRNVGAFSGNIYTASIYLKNAGYNFGFLRLSTNSDVDRYAIVVNLTTGVVTSTNSGGSPTNVTYSVDNIGGGWFRVSLSMGHSSGDVYEMSGSCPSGTPTFAANIPSFAGNGTSGNFLWGAQLNTGALKPYFPTTDRLNVPRLTYQNGGGGCPSLLLEKQSTNLLTYSEQFDNAGWTKSNVTISANSVISPDGTQNADSIIVASGTSAKYVYQTCATATPFAFSVYLKYSSYKWIQFLISGDGDPVANFDIQNGVLGSFSGCSSKIESVGNGWYRCTIFNFTTFGLGPLLWAVDSGTAARADYSSLSGTFYAWGAQAEASSYPTSYIPTTSSTATRVADGCSKTGISSLIGQTEGVVFVDLVMKNNISSVNRVVSITESNWLSGGSIRIDIQAGNIAVDIVNNNASVGNISVNTAFAQNTRYKIAVAYKTNDCALYMNGTQLGTNTSIGTMPTCSEFYLNELGGGFGGPYEPTEFNQAILFKTRLTNAELASLTTI